MNYKILMFGDVVGRLGRQALHRVIPQLKKEHSPDLIIANAENLAHRKGVTKKTLEDALEAGVDFFTAGNEIWGNEESLAVYCDKTLPIIRPANCWPDLSGDGYRLIELGQKKILVVNLLGRDSMDVRADCPFRALDTILEEFAGKDLSGVVVDFHAERTSEKVAFGWHVDGRVSAVFGTHTHIATADTKVLPAGTAYVTDVGYVGARDSVLGVDKKNVLKKFIEQVPVRFEMPDSGVVTVNAVLTEIDAKTKKAISTKRIDQEVEI